MKYLKFIYIILLTTLLSGCVFNDPKYINLRTKPNLYYYSNEIYEKIKNNENQEEFLNGAIKVETYLTPRELMSELLRIE
ncbi:hypothetical protein H6A19_16335, partial [Clostridium saudiense]|nr:hypothetical protein [Clostridium saudiense]